MASAGAIRAGRAFVEIFADTSPLLRGLKQVRGQLTSFGADIAKVGLAFTALGGAVTAPLGFAIKKFGDMGDRLFELSVEANISVEALSELGYAAEQSASSLEAISRNIYLMGQFVSRVQNNANNAADSLEQLGLSFKDIAGLNTEQRFLILAEAVGRVGDAAKRSQLGRDVFGRGFRESQAFINKGAVAIEKLREAFRERGLTVSSADAAAADSFHDTLADVVSIGNRALFLLGAQLAPALEELLKRYLAASKGLLKFISANSKLIKRVAAAAAAVSALGAVIVTAGASVIFFGAVIGTLVSAFSAFLGAIGMAVSLIGFLISPIGLLVLAVGGLAYQFVDFGDVARRALDRLKSQFGPVLDGIKDVVKGIDQSLRSGDVDGAATILFAGMEVVFSAGSLALTKIWTTLWTSLADIAIESIASLPYKIAEALSALPSMWEMVFDAMDATVQGRINEQYEVMRVRIIEINKDEQAALKQLEATRPSRFFTSTVKEYKDALAKWEADYTKKKIKIQQKAVTDRNYVRTKANEGAKAIQAEDDRGLVAQGKAIADSEKALTDALARLTAAVDKANKGASKEVSSTKKPPYLAILKGVLKDEQASLSKALLEKNAGAVAQYRRNIRQTEVAIRKEADRAANPREPQFQKTPSSKEEQLLRKDLELFKAKIEEQKQKIVILQNRKPVALEPGIDEEGRSIPTMDMDSGREKRYKMKLAAMEDDFKYFDQKLQAMKASRLDKDKERKIDFDIARRDDAYNKKNNGEELLRRIKPKDAFGALDSKATSKGEFTLSSGALLGLQANAGDKMQKSLDAITEATEQTAENTAGSDGEGLE